MDVPIPQIYIRQTDGKQFYASQIRNESILGLFRTLEGLQLVGLLYGQTLTDDSASLYFNSQMRLRFDDFGMSFDVFNNDWIVVEVLEAFGLDWRKPTAMCVNDHIFQRRFILKKKLESHNVAQSQ